MHFKVCEFNVKSCILSLLAFIYLTVSSSIFSYVHWPFVFLFLWITSSYFLSIFLLGDLFLVFYWFTIRFLEIKGINSWSCELHSFFHICPCHLIWLIFSWSYRTFSLLCSNFKETKILGLGNTGRGPSDPKIFFF